MKILQINSVCGIRSTGRICTDIADILEKNGHECKIAYGREIVPEKHQKYAVRIGNAISVRKDAFLTRIFDNAGFNSAKETRKFIEWVKEYDPDIIHLHNLHGYYINIKVLFEYLKESGKPVVWTLHDCWAFTGHCPYFDRIGCEKWRSKCENCPQTKKYPKSFVFDRSKQNYKLKKDLFTSIENLTFVTPSQWLANLVAQSYLKDKRVEVIYNGIDSNVFKPTHSDFRKKYNLSNKKIILGVASAWSQNKGLYDFIKLSKIMEENYQIVLVGLTEKQKEVLPPQILCISRTNNVKELAEIYTAADVFVNPTYQDNYPTVNLEAQACGTPVITYRTGGSVESVPAEQVVEQGDLKAMYQNIMALEKLKILEHDFSKENNLQHYIDLFVQK